MNYDKLKRGIVSLALAATFVLSPVVVSGALAVNGYAQYPRDYQRDRYWERQREHEALRRIREMDHERRLRYRYYGFNRQVGYYDRFGRFHAYGYYDRWGRFWRYY